MGSTSFLKLNQDLEANFETVDGRTPHRRSDLNCGHWQRPLFISPAISPTITPSLPVCFARTLLNLNCRQVNCNPYISIRKPIFKSLRSKNQSSSRSNPTDCLRTVVRSNLLNVLEQVNYVLCNFIYFFCNFRPNIDLSYFSPDIYMHVKQISPISLISKALSNKRKLLSNLLLKKRVFDIKLYHAWQS